MNTDKQKAEIKKYEKLAEKERKFIRESLTQIDELQSLINKSQNLANLYDEQAKYLRGERTDDEKEES